MKDGKLRQWVLENIVFCIFILLGIICLIFGKQSPAYVVSELVSRFSRNAISILSLIIPVLCGMGLNFGIVLGAMAGELGLILTIHWHMAGVAGLLVAVLIGAVFSIIFGYLTGKLYNKTKGQETLTGMILGYFAFGLFNLVLINLLGSLIPFKDEVIMLTGGVGLRDTISLSGMTGGFDDVLHLNLQTVILIVFVLSVISAGAGMIYHARKKYAIRESLYSSRYPIVIAILSALALLMRNTDFLRPVMRFTMVPVFTWILIILVALATMYISNTRYGQKVKVIGQNRTVATAAGINVNKVRIQAVIISTIIASLGQIVSLQNIGTMSTYTAHEMVGTYAIAALLVGGASINKATIKQGLVGCILFHLMFFMAPIAARNLFNDTMIGEYVRMFLSYGIIVLSLGLYAWQKPSRRRKAEGEAA